MVRLPLGKEACGERPSLLVVRIGNLRAKQLIERVLPILVLEGPAKDRVQEVIG